MDRIKNLDRFPKAILLLLGAMMVFFAVVYCMVSSRVGFLYGDQILVPKQMDGTTVYEGKIDGKDAVFTVTQDHCVTFRHGEKQYGPYTAKEDPTAVPQDHSMRDYMTGVEVRDGDDIVFRGGILEMDVDGPHWMMVHEDGTMGGITITATMSDGTVVDGDGNVVDLMEPSAATVLHLLNGPELTSKGIWAAWFAGVILSAVNAVSILFADELFRWNLAFRIRYVEFAEPSDWELAGRSISWAVMSIFALVIYCMGLQ